MTFTPVDAAMLFVFAFILVGAGAYAAMRPRFDLMTWAILVGGSLPPALYFAVRVDYSLRAIVFAVFFDAAGWAFLLAVIWIRLELDDFADSMRPQRRPAPAIIAARLPEGGRIPTGAHDPSASPTARLLFGFGGTIFATAGFAVVMLFAPGRHGPALIAFRPDNPVFEICGTGVLFGLALLAVGRWHSRRARRRRSWY